MLTFKGFKVELPYDVIEILDVKIVQSINEHGNLYIKVLINEGRITEYINRNYIDDKIIIFNSHNNKIFVGKTSNIHMIYENGYHSMEISCVSYTKVFDIKKNSRTFCDLDLSYKDVISETLSSYSKKSFIDNISDGKKIEDFILQYEETDWQFLKRIATHFNSVLLSDCTEDYGRIYFGLPEIKNGNVLNCDSYEIVKDITHFNKNEALYLEENDLLEYTKWKVVSDKEFKLGEQIIFNNVKCIICKVEIEVYKELLRTVYTIGRIKGIRTPYTTNDKIFGMSIPATVKDVKGNIMAVHFEIDPVYKSCSNERYFTYAIESSAWYCMPEKESKVHIYFPTN